jgi:hypothetical protein
VKRSKAGLQIRTQRWRYRWRHLRFGGQVKGGFNALNEETLRDLDNTPTDLLHNIHKSKMGQNQRAKTCHWPWARGGTTS